MSSSHDITLTPQEQALIMRLKSFRVPEMAHILEEQLKDPNADLNTFMERMTAMVDAEWQARADKRFNRLMKEAHLRYPAADLDETIYRPERQLDTQTIERLSTCHWIEEGKNLIVTGSSASGKTYLINAFCVTAMKQSKSVKYIKANTLMSEMEQARIKSTNLDYLNKLTKLDLLVIDDFGLMDLDLDKCRDFFEVLDTRDGRKSTVVISQFPVSTWFDMFADNTYADAYLTRITDKHHTFHGGEPLLAYKSMESIVYKLRAKCDMEEIELRFGCTTNATLLNENRLAFISKEIDDFTISMDGAKWTQNYSRPLKSGGESFDIVEKWLKRTLDIFPNLRVRMTFNHKTVGTFFENIKYLGGIGVKYIVPARDFYDCKFGEKEFTILKRQLEKSKEYIASENKELHISLLEKFPFKKMGKCSGGIDSFHIDPEGVLYPCALSVGETDFAIGNVLSGIDKKNRDRLLTYSDKFNEACVGCDLYDFCEQTRCKIVNKLLTGEFCTPSPIVCAENHLLLELN